jgi:hypothetical protein
MGKTLNIHRVLRLLRRGRPGSAPSMLVLAFTSQAARPAPSHHLILLHRAIDELHASPAALKARSRCMGFSSLYERGSCSRRLDIDNRSVKDDYLTWRPFCCFLDRTKERSKDDIKQEAEATHSERRAPTRSCTSTRMNTLSPHVVGVGASSIG